MKALIFRAFLLYFSDVKKYVLPVLLGAGALFLYFKGFKRTLENLRVTLFGIKYDSRRSAEAFFTKVYLDITTKIENPNNQPVKVNEIGITVFRNSRQLASGKQLDPFTIQAKAETKATIKVKFETLQVFKLISDFLKLVNKKEGFNLTVKGYVNVEGNIINFEQTQGVEWPF